MSLFDKITKRAQDSAKKAELELHIAENLPEGLEPYMVYPFPLYGAIGSVGYKVNRSNIPTLLEMFPPVDAVMVKDSSRSLQPADTLKKERGTITPVYPIHIDISTYEVKAEWWAYLQTGELVEIHAELLDGNTLFRIRADWDTDFGRNTLRADWLVYVPTGVTNSPSNAEWELRKVGGNVIKWASGSHDHEHSYTVYFDVENQFQL